MQLPRIRDTSFNAWLYFAALVLPWILTASGVAQSGQRASSVESARIRRIPALAENQNERRESPSQEMVSGGSFQFLCVNFDGEIYLLDSVIGGLDLGRFYPELAGSMLVCATETNRREEMDRFADKFAG